MTFLNLGYMKKKTKLNQYPKFRGDDSRSLSKDQKQIRFNADRMIYGDTMVCNKCQVEQPIKEFYVTNKVTGRRKRSCRDCQMKNANVLNIGKNRFADEIEKKDLDLVVYVKI